MLILSYHHLAFAEQTNEILPELKSIQVEVEKANTLQSLPFAESQKASDTIIKKEKLQAKSSTLGNALAGERGIHSNPFGGGASAPVIRGQEGVRVKILQNGTDVVDMSSVSPDHAITADSLLAEQIELVRGTSTLMYATASQAGVVNVVDKRIPSKMPHKAYEGELFTRYNANNQEKLATLGTIIGIGNHLAIRLEGLTRNSNDYIVPDLVINKGEDPIKKLPDSYNRSQVGTLGVSWIGSRGYLGAAFNQRQDKYGLVGHNHQFDSCAPHFFETINSPYLQAYPHLMRDEDVSKRLHDMHCGNQHMDNAEHSHENIYGHQHDHGERGPWVDLIAKRYDIRGEWQQPIKGLDKIHFASTYSNYHHDERGDGKVYLSDLEKKEIANGRMSSELKQRLGSAEFYKNNPESIYKNKGLNTRLEFVHQPFGDINTTGELKGSWGVQYQTQKSSVKRPFHLVKVKDDLTYKYGERHDTGHTPLIENINKQFSLFGVEQYRIKNLTLEAGIRAEKQTIPISYDQEKLAPYITPNPTNLNPPKPDLSTYKDKAFSYSAGILWDFKPNYRLSLTASHNERLPTPMELYYHGKHLATNSYQYGNRDLNKEQSNNFEIGLMYKGDQWDYKLSTYYNQFKNYINNENLYREGNLFQRRYTQYPAKIYGIDGEISYRFNSQHQITLYGDYVRGKLYNLPNIPVKYTERVKVDYDANMCDYLWDDLNATEKEIDACEEKLAALKNQQPTDVVYDFSIPRPDRNASRMPPARLGITWMSKWNDNWSSIVDVTRVFPQNRTSTAIWVKEKSDDDPTKKGKEHYNIYPISEDSTKAYTMLNLTMDYEKRLNDHLNYKISLNANNLLNEKIYIHNSYLPYVPQIGRNVSLGIQLKF